MNEYDKQQWQAEQAARDAQLKTQREKWAKAKARSARNAQRKLNRLKHKLSESGELTDWEEEFTGSVTERLDKFGSAFQDPEKGRPADALSFAQKRVVAALNKKARSKDKLKDKGQVTGSIQKAETGASSDSPKKPGFKNKKSGFKNKNYVPRVRQIDEDLPEEPAEPFIPEYKDEETKRPFLRVVR